MEEDKKGRMKKEKKKQKISIFFLKILSVTLAVGPKTLIAYPIERTGIIGALVCEYNVTHNGRPARLVASAWLVRG